jgi:hypothetical protein
MPVYADIQDETKNYLQDELNIFNYKNKIVLTDLDLNKFSIEEFFISELSKYSLYLERNIRYIDYDNKYKFKPEYVSVDVYGTPIYYYLILYVNNLKSKRDFIKDSFMNDKIKYRNASALEEIKNNITKKEPDIVNMFDYKLYKI